MKKIFTFFVFVILTVLMSYGQYYYNTPAVTPGGNPGNLNTTLEKPYGQGLAPSWIDIQPASDTLWTNVQTIPFNFVFNGTTVTQYKVSCTGVLTFTTTATGIPYPPNTNLPSPYIPPKSICIWGLRYGSGPNTNDRIVKNTFGTAPNRQHWIFFASYSSNAGGYYCYTYWSIVLEETTNRIYIVDQCNATGWGCQPSLTLGLQYTSTSALPVNGSPNIHSLAGKSEQPYDNKYYEFIPGVQPAWDMSVSYIQTSEFLALPSAPYEIRGIVNNVGTSTVNSYKINYSIDGGTVYSENVTGSNIPIFGDEWYFHDSLWNPVDTGTYKLAVWASNINGNNDQNTANDTMYKMIEVRPIFTPKLQLYEVFTSATNPDCFVENASMKSILDSFPGQYTMVKYQMNYPSPGDIYYTSECGDRASYYSVDSLPRLIVNGYHRINPGFLSEQQFYDYAEPSYMALNVTHHRTGQKFDITANIVPFINFQHVRAHIVIVENVTHNNASTNGETSFYYVMKKMLPDANGTYIYQLYSAVPHPVSKTYTFTTGHTIENFNNLSILSFIQDTITKHILQSAWSLDVSGIDENDRTGNGIVGLFPNPTPSAAFVRYMLTDKYPVIIELYNLIGEKMYSEDLGTKSAGVYTSPLKTEALPDGIYLLQLKIGAHAYSRKIAISK